MKKVAVFLSVAVFLTISCGKGEIESRISNVSFTPCQQDKQKANEKVDVRFTNKGVQITYYNFEVTCDFTTVDVTHTFVNGVLNITQQGTPNQAKCICYTDVSYIVEGISQKEVNVIFINGEQVYCHNNKGNDCYIEDGIYTGIFTVRCSDGSSVSGTTTLELKNGRFVCTGNPNKIPAGGSGNYSAKGDCKIIFEDENNWTADFNWGLILNGEYDYTFDGETLKFSRDIYEYNFVKQSNCDKDVIIDSAEYENAPNHPVHIIDMKIVDNCLKIKFTAPGCDPNEWFEKLIAQEGIAKSNPPIRGVRLSLDNRFTCIPITPVYKETSFNIEDLQIYGSSSVLLNVSGNWILYEY